MQLFYKINFRIRLNSDSTVIDILSLHIRNHSDKYWKKYFDCNTLKKYGLVQLYGPKGQILTIL